VIYFSGTGILLMPNEDIVGKVIAGSGVYLSEK